MKMNRFLNILCFVVLFLGVFQSNAQSLSKADKYFNSFAYQNAINQYEGLWQKDSLNGYLMKQLAVSYRMVNNTEKTEEWYTKVVNTKNASAEDYLNYARSLQSNEKYELAKLYMDKYLELSQLKDLRSIDLDYIKELKKDSYRYAIAPVSVNSEASDFGVAFYNNQVVFSSAKAKPTLIKRNHGWNEQNYLRLYKSNPTEDGELEVAELLSSKLETNYHDGPVCFNHTGDTMFITRNFVSKSKRVKRNNKGIVNIELYQCKKNGDKWTTPELMSLNVEGYSTGHPSLSKDGKRLYFISDRPGGIGGTDIYYTEKNGDEWSKPVNAGKLINTPENEMFPFLSDNNTLYFASKGHAGLGGLDIFYVVENAKSSPVNMGYPINTSKDDFALIMKNGKGYFSSNREKGESFDDIFRFTIQSRIIKGEVFNSETSEVLENATVFLLDKNENILNTAITQSDGKFKFLVDKVQDYKLVSEKDLFTDGKGFVNSTGLNDQPESIINLYQAIDKTLQLEGLVVYRENRQAVIGVNVSFFTQNAENEIALVTNAEGKITTSLERDSEYTIQYHKKGILSKSGYLSTFGIERDTVFIESVVDKVYMGKILALKDILYDLNKSNTRSDAAIELDKLVVIMNDNPSLKIELSSHTDSRGSDAYNMTLSDKRAQSAAKYIIGKGISEERIIAKGYGETRLINHCSNGVECSKSEHQANRRTEVKVSDL